MLLFGVVAFFMELRRNTFPKKEHLCGKLMVDALYEKGEAFFVYPFRVIYRLVPQEKEEDVAVLCMVGVSKRKLKRAVHRNYVKRQTREAYRKNKHDLWDVVQGRGEQLHISFNFIGDKCEKTTLIERQMKKSLKKLLEIIQADGKE